MRKMNKKGAEMTIGTLVAIILGLIVLVVIALGFTMGWQNLWDKINVFSGGSSLATVGQACQIACNAKDANAYCIQGRDIKGLTETQANMLRSPGANYPVPVEVKTDNWKVTGINCAQLKEATLISLGDCGTPPTCG